MKVRILELGEMVVDSVTQLSGMLTLANIDADRNEFYFFQPALISSETLHPVDGFWLEKSRIEGGKQVDVELPLHVLGTVVVDKATGFSGTAIQVYYYQNGCVHLEVKPAGIVPKTGQPIPGKEFDIRRLKGEALVELTKKQLKASKEDAPSPELVTRRMNF
ncbi:MAG: hypothetical protein Q8K92_08375 [Leadbetterella sp.]|nr:hypothetical protein [Leadbetterella sp.]